MFHELTTPEAFADLILLDIFIPNLLVRLLSPLVQLPVVLLHIRRRAALFRRAFVQNLGLGALRTFAWL